MSVFGASTKDYEEQAVIRVETSHALKHGDEWMSHTACEGCRTMHRLEKSNVRIRMK